MSHRSRWHERQPRSGVELYPVEAKLVDLLRERPGEPVPRDVLVRRLWPGRGEPIERDRAHLRELVYRVRSAFEDERGIVPIATVIGRGYVWIAR